ncbi:MAG: type II toxin-antitoxin system HicB family antitoxin, partial [Candidatus Zixiibacteriota bacterium]
MQKPFNFSIGFGDTASVAFETNGRGYLGYIVELPGAFIRGETEEEALKKVPKEVSSYLRWLDIDPVKDYSVQVVQRHNSSIMVEDADSEILLEADKGALEEGKYKNLLDIVLHSGETFLKIYGSAALKDWIDESRIRKTFYGENKKTIREIFEHVKRCQYYYLSRMRIEFETEEEDFRKIRQFCLKKLEDLYR